MLAQLEPHWFVLSETNSTNLYARELLTSMAHTPPFVVFAKHQTAGIGQRGKMWLSQANASITASLVVPLGQMPLGLTPIVAGLGVLDGVTHVLSKAMVNAPSKASEQPFEPCNHLPDKPLCLQLKWPNDVLLNGGKLGGILCERVGSNLVIGVGLNVWPNAYAGMRTLPFNTPCLQPTALFEHCHNSSKPNEATQLMVAKTLFSRLLAYWQMHTATHETFISASHDTICASFAKADALLNKPLDVWQNGKLVGQGLGKGLHADGRYRIQMGEESTLCHSGELSLRTHHVD